MKRNFILPVLALTLFLAGCAAPRPVREYEENTKQVISEQPTLGK